jgi:hypothetical protein
LQKLESKTTTLTLAISLSFSPDFLTDLGHVASTKCTYRKLYQQLQYKYANVNMHLASELRNEKKCESTGNVFFSSSTGTTRL